MIKNENHLLQMADYNYWANDRIRNMILKMDESAWEAEIISSFKSLKETVLHIWDAEVVWFKRMNNQELNDWPSKGIKSNRDKILMDWLAFDKGFIAYAKSLSEAQWNENVPYMTLSSSEPHENTREFMFRHCMNHSTFHRGQIITFLRQLGLKDLMSTDLLVFGREN